MPRKESLPAIRLRGVRQNNLKNLDLDLPLNRLIVLTGLSGSGKSSLAFDTLFAEGQRRYIETFSPYARQFFDRMDKPRVDTIEGIPPAIALEQRNAVRTTRSTVGTMTEICDYMKVIWPHLGQLHCRQCRRAVTKDSPQSIWLQMPQEGDILVTFDLQLSAKLKTEEMLDLIRRQGYQRVLVGGQVVRIDEAHAALGPAPPPALTVIQDRLKPTPSTRARFVDACEQAFHFGKGRLAVYADEGFQNRLAFSQHRHCAHCDLEYREPVPALFSFNHPLGACPTCRGFGRIIAIDYGLAIPDHSRTLAECVVKPWQSGQGAECQKDMMKFARKRGVPLDVPYGRLPERWRTWLIEGDPNYGRDPEHEWPHLWYGVKGYFRWLESKAYKMHVRVLLSRYRAYRDCPDCKGRRFQPETLLYLVRDFEPTQVPPPASSVSDAMENSRFFDLAQFYRLTVAEALAWISRRVSGATAVPRDPVGIALREVQSRLACLVDVGLGYLTLDRATRTLSGGETQRVNLTSCLGTRLVNTLYVLDEPSIGLHPRDVERLTRVIRSLRDLGNTVVVVEHEASVIQAADRIIDLGPGQGERGGHILFEGSPPELLRCPLSLTAQYLNGTRLSPASRGRPVNASTDRLRIRNARRHNLKHLDLEIPLGRFVAVTGVSGSGKTTLVREVIFPLLNAMLNQQKDQAVQVQGAEDDEADLAVSGAGADDTRISGGERLHRVVMVDQSPVGRTPRSNPAVYTGAFEAIRDLFAQGEGARQRGLKASAFSFNSLQGQCERCRGAGYEKIEMQFLSDVYIRCPQCEGKRYRPHVLEVKLPLPANIQFGSPASRKKQPAPTGPQTGAEWNIADFLEATTDDVIRILEAWPDVKPARQARQTLQLLQQVGLGYLRLGQPLTTLSGGENQRLKLAGHLAESQNSVRASATSTLFIFDEPTTGLHFDDVRVLLEVFHGLVDAGHSLLVVEHNLQVIQSADWILDLGPEAGDGGGEVVIEGPPHVVAACPTSHTGAALRANPLSAGPTNELRNRQ